MTAMPEFENIIELVNYHLRLHGGVELRDIYKLIHQSVFGPEHLGPMMSEHAIAEEMECGGSEPEEPLLEPICVGTGACRINLRIARKHGISPATIAEALRASAADFSRDRRELARIWGELGTSLRSLSKTFSDEEFQALTRLMCDQDYPAMHHSAPYRELNRPAYRVLIRSRFDALMQG